MVDQDGSFWYTQKRRDSGVGSVFGHGPLAVSLGGDPVSATAISSDQLIYARSNGVMNWNLTTIDYDIDETGACAIAMPPANGIRSAGYYNPRINPRIAYFDGMGDSIRYATPPIAAVSGRPWSVQVVTGATGVKKIEVGLDKNAKPVIMYFDSAAWSIRLARFQ
jgi:hypothetical protein